LEVIFSSFYALLVNLNKLRYYINELKFDEDPDYRYMISLVEKEKMELQKIDKT